MELRVLGLDPGMQKLGFALIRKSNGNLSLDRFGFINNPKTTNAKYNEYLNDSISSLVEVVPRIIGDYQPHIIVSEYVPVGKLGMNSELVVAAITTFKVISFQFGIKWKDYGANTVKQIITGNGRASKIKVRNVIFDEFPLVKEEHEKIKRDEKDRGLKQVGLPADIFDAIAVALAYIKKEVKDDKIEVENENDSFCSET